MAGFCCASRIIADGKYLSAMSQPNFNQNIGIVPYVSVNCLVYSIKKVQFKTICLNISVSRTDVSHEVCEQYCFREGNGLSLRIYFHQHLLCKIEKDKCLVRSVVASVYFGMSNVWVVLYCCIQNFSILELAKKLNANTILFLSCLTKRNQKNHP